MPPRRSKHNTQADFQVVRLDQLVLLDALQVRVQLNHTTVATYAGIFREVSAEQCTCPPITVFLQDDAYVVADGFHRVHAARQAGRTTLNAYVRTGGTKDEAWLFAMETNITHGMPYTREDKEKIVTWLLDHPRYGSLPTRAIAAMTGNLITHATVANIRNRRHERDLEVLSKLDKTSETDQNPAVNAPPAAATWEDGPTGDERLDNMLDRLENTEADHQAQYQRLRNVEGHMDLLMRRNDPALFGAWLRTATIAVTGERVSVPRLIENDVPRYIAWLQHLFAAYKGVPDPSVFPDTDVGTLEGDTMQ
jgi:hypothetical protein